MFCKKYHPNQRSRAARNLAALFSFVLICQFGSHAIAADEDDVELVDITDDQRAAYSLEADSPGADAEQTAPEESTVPQSTDSALTEYQKKLDQLQNNTSGMSREEVGLLILDLLWEVRQDAGKPLNAWSISAAGDSTQTLKSVVEEWLGPLDGQARTTSNGKLWSHPQDERVLTLAEPLTYTAEVGGFFSSIGKAIWDFFAGSQSPEKHSEELLTRLTSLDKYTFKEVTEGDAAAELDAYISGLTLGLEHYGLNSLNGATGVVAPCLTQLLGTSVFASSATFDEKFFSEEENAKDTETRDLIWKWLDYRPEDWAGKEDLFKSRLEEFNRKNFKRHGYFDDSVCDVDCFTFVAFFQPDGQVSKRALELVLNGNFGGNQDTMYTALLDIYDVYTKTAVYAKKAVSASILSDFDRPGGYGELAAALSASDISEFNFAGLSAADVEKFFLAAGKWDNGTWKNTNNISAGYVQSLSTLHFLKWLISLKDDVSDVTNDTSTDKERDEARRLDLTDDIINNFITYDIDNPEWRLSENVYTGLALSACYRPLQTNINEFIQEYGQSFTGSEKFGNFHDKYGQLRKALLISDTGDAVAKHFRGGQPTNLRVATLDDLLKNPSRDKLLIPQGTYYNKDKMGITFYSTKEFGTYVFAQQDDAFMQFSETALDQQVSYEDMITLLKSEDSYASGSTVIPPDGSMWYDRTTEQITGAIDDAGDKVADTVAGTAGALYKTSHPIKNWWYGGSVYRFFTGKNRDIGQEVTDEVAASIKAELEEGKTIAEIEEEMDVDIEKIHEGAISLPFNNLFNTNFAQWQESSFSFSHAYSTHQFISTDIHYRLQDAVKDLMEKDVLTYANSADKPSSFSGVHRFTGLSITLSIIYDRQLRDWMNQSVTQDTPVFISSGRPIEGAPDYIYFNYLQLENIAANNPINYVASVDRHSPLFMDIYGNILTESDMVVIPAAANASFGGPSVNGLSDKNAAPERKYHNWMTVSNLVYYGDKLYFTQNKEGKMVVGKRIVDAENNSMFDASDYAQVALDGIDPVIFTWDADTERYYLNSLKISGQGASTARAINVSLLSDGEPEALKSLYVLNNDMYHRRIPEHKAFDVQKYITQVMYEVTRGAYFQNIDYKKEGLSSSRRFTNGELSQAAKFENFYESVSSEWQNTILSIPDLAYMEGLEYIIFFVYRLLLITFTLAVSIQVYHQAAKSKLTPLVFLKMCGTYILSFIIIIYMPSVFSASYYMVNKALLQDEALMIAGLGQEKAINGVNLGVTRASSVDSKSEVLIKVDDIDIPWYRLLGDIAVDPSITSMQEVYNSYINTLPTTSEKFKIKGNGVYVDIADLYDSSQIFTSSFGVPVLQHSVNEDPDASFYLPYYAILDYVIYNINDFNSSVNCFNYKDYLYGDGRKRSIGLVKNYFLSDAFLVTASDIDNPRFKLPGKTLGDTLTMAARDKIGVNQFYGNTLADPRTIFMTTEGFEASQWYREQNSMIDLKTKRDKLDEAAVAFVVKNRDLLGRISDEVFLKTFALHMSLEFNKVFKSGGPTSLEISNIATDDIIRMSIEEQTKVMMDSPYSYPRFLLESQGLVTVYTGAILHIVYLIGGFVKPVATIIIFMAMFLSIYIYKCLLHRSTDNLRGFFWMTIALCIGNVLHGVILKLSLFLPAIGTPPVICIFMQLLLQIAYIIFYLWLTSLIVLNWRDLGSQTFRNIFSQRSLRLSKVSAGNWGFGQDMHGSSDSGDYFGDKPRQSKKTASREEYERMKNLDKIRKNYEDFEDQ